MTHSARLSGLWKAWLLVVVCLTLVATGGAQGAAAAGSDPSISTARTVTFSNDANYACNTVNQTNTVAAVTDAITYAQAAKAYFDNGYRGARYITWFGAYDATRWSAVATRVSSILAGLTDQNLIFKCPQPVTNECSPGSYGFVHPNVAYEYYLCDAFFNSPATGTDSRAGTLIHSTSQFTAVAGGIELAFGQTAAQSLAITNPASAALNGDNFEYFAENTPAISVAVASVSVSPASASLYVGESTALTAAVTPTNADNQNLVWTTSDASVATVSSTGQVFGLSGGIATITATSVDGSHAGTSTVTVAVHPPAPNPPAAPASSSTPTPTASPSSSTTAEPAVQSTVAPEVSTPATAPLASTRVPQRWTLSRIRAMRARQMMALTANDVAAMLPRVFARFSVTQLGYLRPTVAVTLRPGHIQTLSPAQIQALRLASRARLLSQAQRLAIATVLRTT